MATYKRPKLSDRGESARTGSRDPVRIPCTCQIGGRPEEDCFVLDLSARGCRVRAVTIGVTKTETVMLRFAGEAPIEGRLKWAKQASLGIAFEAPLSDEVLARVSALVAPSNVVPLKRAKLG